ncbi:hypothetical protein EYB25_002338 [Talaromyces marneffei]|nr:hypothetical protein EYB25_002338 [Talaromyces marneffei]
MAPPIVDQIFHQLPSHLRNTRHIRERHSQHIILFQQYHQQFPERIRHHRELVIPHKPIAPIPGLIPPRDPTYQCSYPGCHWIGETIRRIHDHCRQEHGWKNPQNRGRPRSKAPSKPQPNMPWNIVASQRFIPKGRGSQRFAVQHDHTTITTAISDPENPSWDAAQQAMKQEIIHREQQIDAAERERIRPHESREVNP